MDKKLVSLLSGEIFEIISQEAGTVELRHNDGTISKMAEAVLQEHIDHGCYVISE